MKRLRFVVARILGNELPPRDRAGQRLEVLRFQLRHEPRHPDSERLWLLNRLHDADFRAALVAELEAAGERWEEMPFDLDAYARCLTRRQKLVYAINVNGARNRAIELATAQARFALVLDGDCWLGARDWELLVEAIDADQKRSPDRRYYSLPMIRAAFDEALSGDFRRKIFEEPQLAFRDDAELRFDESLAFGDKDKVELLERLGHESYVRGRTQEHALAAGALCASVARVVHLQTGDDAVEKNRVERGRLRELSVRRLLADLDARARPRRGWLARAAAALTPAPAVSDAELREPRFRADLRFFDAGDGLCLAYGSRGAPALLPEPLARAVATCERFHTAREHAGHLLDRKPAAKRHALRAALDRWREREGLPRAGELREDLADALRRLAGAGFFVDMTEVLELCGRAERQAPAGPAAPALIAHSAGERTAAKAGELARAAREAGAARLFVCPTEADTAAWRASVARAAAGAPLTFLGAAERAALAEALVERGADPQAARLALRPGGSGAARNALLLAAAGGPVLMIDDDAAPLETGPLDGPAAHERWLGCALGPSTIDFQWLTTEALRRLRAGKGRLIATFRAVRPVRPDGRPGRDRAARDLFVRKTLGLRRETPGFDGASLTDGADLEAGELGLDLREDLAPFPTGLAGEDEPFAAALALCRDEDLFARLPGELSRPASRVRGFPAELSEKAGARRAALLAHALRRSAPRQSEDGARRRAALARALAELAALPDRAFAAELADELRRRAEDLALAHEREARACRTWSPLRADFLDQQARLMLQEAVRDDLLRPLDGDASSPASDARDFARLLQGWPSLLDAARRLGGKA